MATDIKYKLKNGKAIYFNPNTKDSMSYSELKKTYEGKVVSLEDLAKALGIKKPKSKASQEEDK
mgnify:CR=1 FL=1